MTPQWAALSQERIFACQQSGNCCRDPKIIVTLTYRDLYLLYAAEEQDFHSLLKRITFYALEDVSDEKIRERLVLTPIQVTEGQIIPGLRKDSAGDCVFYVRPDCSIYQYRPLACRNYPLTFRKLKGTKALVTAWAKNATKTCPGIGKGVPFSEKAIQEMGEHYFEEVKKHNALVENLNLEAQGGKPLTAREAIWVAIMYAQNELQTQNED
ncbi:MAG: YkgJ family cysteine cluster protein [Candidatus Heimdallarchaeota archaeon]